MQSAGRKVLVIDVGGTYVKVRATDQDETRRHPSGRGFGPEDVVRAVREMTRDWDYEVVAIGYPGPVLDGRLACEPRNLGEGWVGFDFERAFGKPVKLVNDAAMQALGSYEGGKMLFLGLGTGLGSALVSHGRLEPAELAHLPYKGGKTYEEWVGKRGLKRLGRKMWRRAVHDVVERLGHALQVDYVVIGGGNASKLEALPPQARLGDNEHAFRGGFRLWGSDGDGASSHAPARSAAAVAPASPGDQALKELAGRRAAELVQDGMRVGLGTGSTVRHTILALGERKPDIRCVATSERTHELAAALGLTLLPPDEIGRLDLAIDGADAVDAELNLVKGGGGAHAREKIVAAMAERFVVIVEESKLVERLGAFPLPLELLPFAAGVVAEWVRELGAERVTAREARSDNGNVLLDAHFGSIDDPAALAARLAALPGLVAHGIFPGEMVERVIVAGRSGLREIVRGEASRTARRGKEDR